MSQGCKDATPVPIIKKKDRRMQELPGDIITQHAWKGSQLVQFVRLQLVLEPHAIWWKTKCSFRIDHGIVD